MNDPKLDLLIREKMRKYLPDRPVQVMHCGVILLVSMVLGVFYLPSESGIAGDAEVAHKGMGIYFAISGLAIYFIWSYLRADKARKEAQAEFLSASSGKEK